MLEILKADLSDAGIINRLAHQIYYPTYTGILSIDQMDFMLGKSYTIEALRESMVQDQHFYIVYENKLPVGFVSFFVKTDDILRIEKLYLLPTTQGRGIGSEVIRFAEKIAIKYKSSILELNVNRGNNAYYFYLKMGFEVVEKVDIPYFGYVLDDYVMQMKID